MRRNPQRTSKKWLNRERYPGVGWGHASGWKLKCDGATKDEQQGQMRRGSRREGRERNMTQSPPRMALFVSPLSSNHHISSSFPHRSSLPAATQTTLLSLAVLGLQSIPREISIKAIVTPGFPVSPYGLVSSFAHTTTCTRTGMEESNWAAVSLAAFTVYLKRANQRA